MVIPTVPDPVPVISPPLVTPLRSAPVPPCAIVTAAFVVRIVAEAFGSVKVLDAPDGPENAMEELFKPPFAVGSRLATSAVRSTVENAGDPPVTACSRVCVVPPAMTLISLAPFPSTTEPPVRGPDVFVTVPPALAGFQVPSPYQTVEEEAFVPLLRCATPRFPVTPPAPDAARLMAGRSPAERTPLDIFEAFRALMVADGAKASPLVVLTDREHPALLTSPLNVGSCEHEIAEDNLDGEIEVNQGGLAYVPLLTIRVFVGMPLSTSFALESEDRRLPDVKLPEP